MPHPIGQAPPALYGRRGEKHRLIPSCDGDGAATGSQEDPVQWPAQRGASRETLHLRDVHPPCGGVHTHPCRAKHSTRVCSPPGTCGAQQPQGSPAPAPSCLQQVFDGTRVQEPAVGQFPTPRLHHLHSLCCSSPPSPLFCLQRKRWVSLRGVRKAAKNFYGRFLVCARQIVWCNKGLNSKKRRIP